MLEVRQANEANGQGLQVIATDEPQLLQFTQAAKGLRQANEIITP